MAIVVVPMVLCSVRKKLVDMCKYFFKKTSSLLFLSLSLSPLFLHSNGRRYNYFVAVALSLFLGMFGIDRFYLGYPAIGHLILLYYWYMSCWEIFMHLPFSLRNAYDKLDRLDFYMYEH